MFGQAREKGNNQTGNIWRKLVGMTEEDADDRVRSLRGRRSLGFANDFRTRDVACRMRTVIRAECG